MNTKITRPLRHNGVPYSGINILMLWSAAMAGGFAAPICMTFKQALELNAHVRKGEKGSLVSYTKPEPRMNLTGCGKTQVGGVICAPYALIHSFSPFCLGGASAGAPVETPRTPQDRTPSEGQRQQIPHPHQIIDGDGKGEEPANARHAPQLDLPQQTHGFQPAKDLFDPFAFPVAHGIPKMACGSPVNGTRPSR